MFCHAYADRNHWVLLVIVMSWAKVFYLDSSAQINAKEQNTRNFTEMRSIVTDADVVFKNREGDVNFMKKASKLTHVFNLSPLRQPNNMSCGYYQCVLMDEIVCHFASCENKVQLRRNMTSLKERFDHNRELEGIIQFLRHLINVEMLVYH